MPPAQVDAALLYAKGKGYYRQGSWNDATAAFSQVGSTTDYGHQARYFQGLVAMKVARANAGSDKATKTPSHVDYKAAIEAFKAVTDLPPDTAEHRHVIDLSWMAIGRLFYEMEQYQQAAEAYSKVDRDSPEFDTMLYELAWVYVRLGDVDRAERSLEVLAVARSRTASTSATARCCGRTCCCGPELSTARFSSTRASGRSTSPCGRRWRRSSTRRRT